MAGLVLETKQVPTKDLSVFHKNPRVGNVEAIAESLSHNGQYKAIVVNLGSKTGRENEILCGNHTYLAARRLGWDQIEASLVDVDDELATTIVLADNKTADLGEYEEALLAELFQSLPSSAGTGYTDQEMSLLIAEAEGAVDHQQAQKTLDDYRSGMPVAAEGEESEEGEGTGRSTAQILLDTEGEDKKEDAARRGAARPDVSSDDEEEPYDAIAELHVLLELKETDTYKGDNAWGIPELREDMLMEELPKDLITWGGHEATPDDGRKWFLYNYSLGGRKGLPPDRSILCFYTYDHKFEQWWSLPAYYTAKHMGAGFKNAVVPDFSFYYSETRAHHLWSVYKAQWLGRFFQESGMRVAPRLQFDYTDPNTLEIALLGIPRGCPILFTSIQNVEDEAKNIGPYSKLLKDALDEIKPKTLVVYGGPPGFRVADAAKWKGNIVKVPNYAAVRRNTVFDKKDGGAKMSASKRKQLKEKLAEEMGVTAEPSEREREYLMDEKGEY